MAYSFRIASSQYIEQDGFLYVRPTSPSTSSLNHWSNSASYFWMYNSVGGTLEVSDTYGKDAQSSATTLYFSTDSTIEINNHRYEFYCTAQLHETTPGLNGYTSQNTQQVITANGGSYYYFYTKIYRLVNTKITITFNANGGSVSPSSTTGWGGDSITLPTPTWNAAHTFKGWYLNGTRVGGGGDTYTVPVGTESSITLTALWIESYSGNITWTGTQSHVIGTYTYTDDGGNLSLSWNITQTQITDNGRIYYFNTIRIRYIPSSQSTSIIWQSNQTSGTFDNSSITQGISVLYYPPTCTMYYFGDSLLYSGLSSGGGKLIYNRSNGRLCYGPKLIL